MSLILFLTDQKKKKKKIETPCFGWAMGSETFWHGGRVSLIISTDKPAFALQRHRCTSLVTALKFKVI